MVTVGAPLSVRCPAGADDPTSPTARRPNYGNNTAVDLTSHEIAALAVIPPCIFTLKVIVGEHTGRCLEIQTATGERGIVPLGRIPLEALVVVRVVTHRSTTLIILVRQ